MRRQFRGRGSSYGSGYRPVGEDYPCDSLTETVIDRVRSLERSSYEPINLDYYRSETQSIFASGLTPIVEYYLEGDMGDVFTCLTGRFARPWDAIAIAEMLKAHAASFTGNEVTENVEQMGLTMIRLLSGKARLGTDIATVKLMGIVRQAFLMFRKQAPRFMPHEPTRPYTEVYQIYKEKKRQMRDLWDSCVQHISNLQNGGFAADCASRWKVERACQLAAPTLVPPQPALAQPPAILPDLHNQRLPVFPIPDDVPSVGFPAILPGQPTPPQDWTTFWSQDVSTSVDSSVQISTHPPSEEPVQSFSFRLVASQPTTSPSFPTQQETIPITNSARESSTPLPPWLGTEITKETKPEFIKPPIQNPSSPETSTVDSTVPRQRNRSQPNVPQKPVQKSGSADFFIGLDENDQNTTTAFTVETMQPNPAARLNADRLRDLQERFGSLWNPSSVVSHSPGTSAD